MIHIGEWITSRILRLVYRLEYEMFMNKERRARIQVELSTLLKQREELRKYKEQLAKEKKAKLKDPNWKR